MEIYNEKVRDLLDPKSSNKRNLKVREHTILGPMVDGLSVLAVSSFEQIARLIDEGNKCRTVAATNMNTESSRSHAVFTIRLTQIVSDLQNDFSGEKVSKISLVDLAGSERAQKSGAVGKRLEEGANINKSLTTLGMVISALAERNSKKEKFVPYRDSVLTWLLKDNLGGNSRTVMIATVSPAADNYEETLSTLRYADRAKKIVNHAVINEDPNAKIIRELREEVDNLRQQITETRERQVETNELRERLAESERLIEMMNKSWEERLKETEMVYKERQKDLAEIGISLAESGIKMEKNRFYLVNLNADPSMNELLVYYINHKAIIGNGEPSGTPDNRVDIVLQGIGVYPRHALLEVLEEDGCSRLYVSSLAPDARIRVNGRQIEQKTLLRNGFRLLIGNNYLFRANCPKDSIDEMSSSICMPMMEDSMCFDYDNAWIEANADDSRPSAVDQYIEQLAIKHEAEKQAALEKQYEEFERYIQNLTQNLQTPSTPMTPAYMPPMAMTPLATPSCHFPPVSFPPSNRNIDKPKFFQWAQKREEHFREGLRKLKKEILKANSLVREANLIVQELMGPRRGAPCYEVTLQIPAANLRPSRIKGENLICEPVIVVRRFEMTGFQLWNIEQLENKLVDMREMYNDRICGTSSSDFPGSSSGSSSGVCEDEDFESDASYRIDTHFSSQERHSLIGVANVFLEVLIHDLKLDYNVPIISQHGEVCGKLHVEVYRIPDQLDTSLSDSTGSLDSEEVDEFSMGQNHGYLGRNIKCRIRIKKAMDLPASLSHFVFCQYSFFCSSDMLVVAPTCEETNKCSSGGKNFKFEHEKDFIVRVNEEFLEYLQEDALSIEVWGTRSPDLELPSAMIPELDANQAQVSLQERWAEVTKKIELWVDIKELNENGEYCSVEVNSNPNVLTGGVYQLRQGIQRRIVVRVRSLEDSYITVSDITSVAIGSIVVVNPADETFNTPLDSYAEVGLEQLRQKWNQALLARQQYLEQQINKMSKAPDKTPLDTEREQSLISQWVALTEERNAVYFPPPNSNIPGAPADWLPPPGIESHVPILFLDTNPDYLCATDEPVNDYDLSNQIIGANVVLPYESYDQMTMLPILEHDNIEMTATCSWDSSIHSCPSLNRASANPELIYAVVWVIVRLSHPISLDLVLRKRICLNVYKKPSLAGRFMRKLMGSDILNGSGIIYNIIPHIPKSSSEVENRASLAFMAARNMSMSEEDSVCPSNTRIEESEIVPALNSSYIESYARSIRAVEWMLKLDRLRQESAMYNTLNRRERSHRMSNFGLPNGPFRMKRTISLPNTINNLTLPPIPSKSPLTNNSSITNNPETTAPPEAINRHNRLMEISISGSSGYGSSGSAASSMVNSLVSPLMESSLRLSGIDEENYVENPKEPVRSSTVPETLHASSHIKQEPKMFEQRMDNLNNNDTSDAKNRSDSKKLYCTNKLFEADLKAPIQDS
uniref:Kinesin motor domain-containing protein n=1 Tax=Acrobeloides nanus TaxID=290746 RepID=A0A914C1N4_9BILA